MTSRIHRGFHRIGVVLAMPLILLSVALAGHEARPQWTTPDPGAPFPVVEPAPKKPPNPFDQFDPSAPKPGLFDDLIPEAPICRADHAGALGALAIAVSLYAAARAVGWVLAGRIGVDRP